MRGQKVTFKGWGLRKSLFDFFVLATSVSKEGFQHDGTEYRGYSLIKSLWKVLFIQFNKRNALARELNLEIQSILRFSSKIRDKIEGKSSIKYDILNDVRPTIEFPPNKL